MIILNLEPRSPEWFKHRQGTIGASDYAAIMSGKKNSIIQSKLDILNGKQLKDNIYSLRGQEIEPLVRKFINKKTAIDFKELVAAYEPYQYIITSYDGISQTDKAILEIKTIKYPVNSDAYNAKMRHYAHQLTHQFYTADNPDYTIYLGVMVMPYDDNKATGYLTIYKVSIGEVVEFDPIHAAPTGTDYEGGEAVPFSASSASKKDWFKTCSDFMQELFIAREGILQPHTDDEIPDLLQEYLEQDSIEKTAKKRKDEIKAIIERDVLNGTDAAQVNGFKCTRYASKTSINYEKYFIDNNITVPAEYKVININYQSYIEDNAIKIPDGYVTKTMSVKISKEKIK